MNEVRRKPIRRYAKFLGDRLDRFYRERAAREADRHIRGVAMNREMSRVFLAMTMFIAGMLLATWVFINIR